MAISARPEADTLSDLARSFVTAARGPQAEAVADDPFTLALKRYQASGIPEDLGARWRHTRAQSAEGTPDLSLLRKLDRDLLSGVVRYATEPTAGRPLEDEDDPPGDAPVSLSIGVATGDGVPPALVLGEDGRWHADDLPDSGAAAPRGRLAALAGLPSRYPDAAAVASARPLLDRIGPQAAASAVAARVKTVAPPPAFFPPSEAELQPLSEKPTTTDDELLQSVSGGVELVVGPFTRLQHLAQFTRAIQEMPGIADVSARQFEQGMVHIRVHYSDDVPLVTRLAQLREFSPTVVASTKTRIELKVEPPDRTPATP